MAHLPRAASLGAVLCASLALARSPAPEERSFTAFESGQVRPLALSPDGEWLYATNTPDNRLEVLKVLGGGRLLPFASVSVGLEPVAVAVRSPDEVWVVNHLSDSVSVVDVSQRRHPVVRRTLLVGDEPRDVVFAGPGRSRAFVTTAHRGQNTARDPQLTTPGVGRADVWVFDGSNLGDSLGGTPLAVLTLFTDTPRALASTPDGATVYVAGFHTGNRTTTVNERHVTNGPGLPPPFVTAGGVPTPGVGLIVRFDGAHWVDAKGRTFDSSVRFSLPDHDVFAIDAMANPPAQRPGPSGAFSGVGSTLFDVAVNPVSGAVYVANLDAKNLTRFEGHNRAGDGTSVRGNIAESRITVLTGGAVLPRHLNKHIDYATEGTAAERAASLAFPVQLAVSADGEQLYVAALGSSKIGVLQTRALEQDTFTPSESQHVAVSGGGPSGLALDDRRGRLYVMTRFDNGISTIDTRRRRELHHVTLFNPEPASLVAGRPFLYDARQTSGHGDSACASCHVFGDLDALAWDLGDPDAALINNPGPFKVPPSVLPGNPNPHFHPLKGPMTTQSLRGMANHGPMHWRGDRTGGNDAPTAQPDSGTFDEDAAFKKFNVAFEGLLGRSSPLGARELQAFTDFVLQLTYPPNPIRNLDGSLTPAQAAGRDFYFRTKEDGSELPSDTFRNCNGCHVLDPRGNAEHGVAKPGFFGSDGSYSFEAETQFMKVPHLRNAYQKVGMFGMAPTFRLPVDGPIPLLSFLPAPLNVEAHLGDQVRGFGFIHDGSVDTMFRFFGASVFVQRPADDPFPNPGGIPADATGVALRRQLEAFVLAFDTNLMPIVGQQVTWTEALAPAVEPRIQLLLERARAGDCEVVVKTAQGGRELGFLYDPAIDAFQPDRSGAPALARHALVGPGRRQGGPVTFTAVPLGTGRRIAIDRDGDRTLDGDDPTCRR